jgi:hypothetical protein
VSLPSSTDTEPSAARRIGGSDAGEHRERSCDARRCIVAVVVDDQFGGEVERVRLGETAERRR